MSESVVVAQCLEWLAVHRIFAWRNNTGGHRTEAGGWVSYGHKGSGDIIGLLPNGTFLSVECKTEVGRQRPAQKLFQRMVERSGGVYVLARSAVGLERALVEHPRFASFGLHLGRRDGPG